MSEEAPSVEAAVAALEDRIDRAIDAGHTVLAAEVGVLLGYVLAANGHPKGRGRAEAAARAVARGDELERPLALARAWHRADQ